MPKKCDVTLGVSNNISALSENKLITLQFSKR